MLISIGITKLHVIFLDESVVMMNACVMLYHRHTNVT